MVDAQNLKNFFGGAMQTSGLWIKEVVNYVNATPLITNFGQILN